LATSEDILFIFPDEHILEEHHAMKVVSVTAANDGEEEA